MMLKIEDKLLKMKIDKIPTQILHLLKIFLIMNTDQNYHQTFLISRQKVKWLKITKISLLLNITCNLSYKKRKKRKKRRKRKKKKNLSKKDANPLFKRKIMMMMMKMIINKIIKNQQEIPAVLKI